ncbi:uncharacterized protein LAESUDRAFT_759867 [Laetiporus sulphureus 93-53]|uniref:LCCL domain-containing protein n=1 Tax=Laetiporus sulphureus 93-53 TaxID=1314785 RepID=A0A165E010_9APHY|nr:uncharacterized protein LAESUDRAFT_759867 [Laetiporus sulphureus 93-53]KZT05983.1 hypothetical protein LAESUDRAFT_759867 [Laetiporus sulphureus 93-53]
MAVPPEMTVLNISGKYIMSKSLSDHTDEILRLQGLGWLKRKIIRMGTLYLSIKHYTDENSIEHIDILQTLSGLSNTDEDRILDWEPRPHEDDTFGNVLSQSKRVSIDEVDNEWLKKGWTKDTREMSLVLTRAESDTAKNGTRWVAVQTWGFEEINGEKRHVRHVDFTGPEKEKVQARLVYDYQGTL